MYLNKSLPCLIQMFTDIAGRKAIFGQNSKFLVTVLDKKVGSKTTKQAKWKPYSFSSGKTIHLAQSDKLVDNLTNPILSCLQLYFPHSERILSFFFVAK